MFGHWQLFLQLSTWRTIRLQKDIFLVNRLGGYHSKWEIKLEGQCSHCFNRNDKFIYALVGHLAFVDEFDFNFVVFLGFPKIWLMELYLGSVGIWDSWESERVRIGIGICKDPFLILIHVASGVETYIMVLIEVVFEALKSVSFYLDTSY